MTIILLVLALFNLAALFCFAAIFNLLLRKVAQALILQNQNSASLRRTTAAIYFLVKRIRESQPGRPVASFSCSFGAPVPISKQ